MNTIALRSFGAANGGRWRIVGLHQIRPEDQQAFARQLQQWHRWGYRFCGLSEGLQYLQAGSAGRWLTVTFDDGDRSVLENGVPVLRDWGVKAIQYITTDYVQRGMSYRDEEPRATMTWDELRAWREAGHEVGMHTHTHPRLIYCSRAEQIEELDRASYWLRQELGQSRFHFAYPYGDHEPAVRDLLSRRPDLLSAVTTEGGWNTKQEDIWTLRRDMVEAQWTPPKVWRHLWRQNVTNWFLPKRPAEEKSVSVPGKASGRICGVNRQKLFHALSWWKGRRRGVPVSFPGGRTVRLHPRYRHAVLRWEEAELLRAAVRPGAVVVEAGAGFGLRTGFMVELVGQSGSIHAGEFQVEKFEHLRQTVHLNHWEKIVTCYPVAWMERVKTLSLEASRLEKQRMTSPGQTLDEFARTQAIVPDVIRIDVPGLELKVLRGAAGLVTAGGQELVVLLTQYPSWWRQWGEDQASWEETLRRLNLRWEPLDGYSPECVPGRLYAK